MHEWLIMRSCFGIIDTSAMTGIDVITTL